MAPYAADVTDSEFVADVAPQDNAGMDRWREFNETKLSWPVRRLSSRAVDIGGIPSESVAQQIYTSSDDLAFSVDDQDVPTRQRIVGPDTDGDGNPNSALARESRSRLLVDGHGCPHHQRGPRGAGP